MNIRRRMEVEAIRKRGFERDGESRGQLWVNTTEIQERKTTIPEQMGANEGGEWHQ